MRVNGKEIPLNAPISLQAFLLEQHYDLRTIAVERNEEIVPKATYAEVMLQDCDVLEVVHFDFYCGFLCSFICYANVGYSPTPRQHF